MRKRVLVQSSARTETDEKVEHLCHQMKISTLNNTYVCLYIQGTVNAML